MPTAMVLDVRANASKLKPELACGHLF